MSSRSYILLALLVLIAAPGAVLASEELDIALDVIRLPGNQEPVKFDFERVLTLKSDTFAIPNTGKKNNNNQLCSLKKSFGPLDLKLNLSPFNINNSDLVFGIDLLRSYEIFSSSQNLAEIAEAFQPKADQYILNPELRLILNQALISINDRFNQVSSVPEVQ